MNIQHWKYKLSEELIDFAKLILNWHKILYDFAPRPSISKISFWNCLTNEPDLDLDLDHPDLNLTNNQGFKFFKSLYKEGFAIFEGDQIRILGHRVPYWAKQVLLRDLYSNFPEHKKDLCILRCKNLQMDSSSFALSENREIIIRTHTPSMFPVLDNHSNRISIMINGLPSRSLFSITVTDLKGLGQDTTLTCHDLISHMLTISEIQFNIDGFDVPVILRNLQIPLDSRLFDVRQDLFNAMSNESYEEFESFKKLLVSLPGLPEDAKETINSITNPYSPIDLAIVD